MNTKQNDEHVDVLICGSGSAGLACALWLATYNARYSTPVTNGSVNGSSKVQFPKPITYSVLEAREGPLKLGQADGVQCRTVEIYESFGLDHILKNEGYWVNELSFWATDSRDGKTIVRTGRDADVLPGLSHQPHLILNQARINGLMLEKIKELKGRDVQYGWKVAGVEVENSSDEFYPCKVVAAKEDQQQTFRARYVLGAEGAHSPVRRSLKIPMEGDSTNATWGVMDVFPRTTFPDIRKKTTIRSSNGTLIIIPREGDCMVRNYIELPTSTDPKTVTLEDLQLRAKSIFAPYEIDFEATTWWSAYSIGQRVAKSVVDPSGRVFLAGDACHTHSPKAGQGMNASLQDGYNLGWKLGTFLTGQADERILQTYVEERHEYAKQLIDFDRTWAKMFQVGAGHTNPEDFNRAFVKGGVFTAGMGADYSGSPLIANAVSQQSLARNVQIGQRLPSAQVVRMSDSKPFPLLKLLQSDGRWRIIVFAGNVDATKTLANLNKVGEELANGVLASVTPPGQPSDTVIETLVVLEGQRERLEFSQLHQTFTPNRHDYPIRNIHKVFFDDESWNWGHGQVYKTLGIDQFEGCIVVARPDQYVSAVLSLADASKLQNLFQNFFYRSVSS